MSSMKVKAAPGVKFPMEHNAKKYITGEPIEVESSAYYRRAVNDGDLILVGDVPIKTDSTPKAQSKKDKQAVSNE